MAQGCGRVSLQHSGCAGHRPRAGWDAAVAVRGAELTAQELSAIDQLAAVPAGEMAAVAATLDVVSPKTLLALKAMRK